MLNTRALSASSSSIARAAAAPVLRTIHRSVYRITGTTTRVSKVSGHEIATMTTSWVATRSTALTVFSARSRMRSTTRAYSSTSCTCAWGVRSK